MNESSELLKINLLCENETQQVGNDHPGSALAGDQAMTLVLIVLYMDTVEMIDRHVVESTWEMVVELFVSMQLD
jgi:hypothetical protein